MLLWTANTERFTDVTPGKPRSLMTSRCAAVNSANIMLQAGVNDTADNILRAIDVGAAEIAPSTVFAVAAILEGCTFINGSPQNTLVPGVVALALRHDVQVQRVLALVSAAVAPMNDAQCKPCFVSTLRQWRASHADEQVAGDDFKSGQTKIKSVLVDYLVSAGIKVSSIVSYNHLGNNDGKNLSAPEQFRSKEISKSNVVDDMVLSNGLL